MFKRGQSPRRIAVKLSAKAAPSASIRREDVETAVREYVRGKLRLGRDY